MLKLQSPKMLSFLLFIALLLLLPVSLKAQENPRIKARLLIEGLTERKSFIPLEELAGLDSASAEVCKEIAEELVNLNPQEKSLLINHLAQSSNPYAHAILLRGLESQSSETLVKSLHALTRLEYSSILALKEHSQALDIDSITSFQTPESWKRVLAELLLELSSSQASSTLRHHQERALALFFDLYIQDGGKLLVEATLQQLVGQNFEQESEDLLPEDEPLDEEASSEEEYPSGSPAFLRNRARETFSNILGFDAERFQLGQSSGFEVRQKQALLFWENYQLLLQTPFTSWRQHLMTYSRAGESEDERTRAMLIMDDLCNGVTITKVQGEKSYEIPVFEGESDPEKISTFLTLDTRKEKRPRIRQIKKIFRAMMMLDDES